MKQKVILDPHFRRVGEIFTPPDRERLNALADVVWGRDEPMPENEVTAVGDEVEAIVGADWRYGPIERFPRLRAFLEVSGRFPDPETFDYAACFARGIRVLSCAPAFAPSVAEMALSLALAVARDVAAGDTALRAGTERFGWAGNANVFHLFDQPVGFIGFGSIARTLKPLLAPFRCPIQVYDPWLTDAFLRTQGVEPVGLERLLETSKVTFVLAAPTATNRALLGREHLARIPRGAVLILVSRAHLVDFDALTEMLYEGRFRAGIDVYPIEPLPADHPIRKAPGAVLSAHRAGGDANGFRSIGRIVVNDLEAILAGHAPQEMQSAQLESIRNQGSRAQSTSERYVWNSIRTEKKDV
jgi:phosphoglycerate dehydrogenase-like enzyme